MKRWSPVAPPERTHYDASRQLPPTQMAAILGPEPGRFFPHVGAGGEDRGTVLRKQPAGRLVAGLLRLAGSGSFQDRGGASGWAPGGLHFSPPAAGRGGGDRVRMLGRGCGPPLQLLAVLWG